ncbi:MAG: metallophosphoesterase family protein [Phycisphaerales bacterium]
MNIIAFSDIHTDLHAIEKFRSQAESADLLIGAGDYCNMRRGLQPVIDAIASIGTPAVLVHGNAENDTELNEAAAPTTTSTPCTAPRSPSTTSPSSGSAGPSPKPPSATGAWTTPKNTPGTS